jgi:hypothetical protein
MTGDQTWVHHFTPQITRSNTTNFATLFLVDLKVQYIYASFLSAYAVDVCGTSGNTRLDIHVE